MPESREPTPRVEAACEACGKTFRVPDAGRTYRCKACGGAVRAAAAPRPASAGADGLVACAGCDALNPPGSAFCAECGAALAAPAVRGGSRSKRRTDAERRAASDLQRSFKAIRAIGLLFRFFAVLYALGTVGAVLMLRDPDVPLGRGLVGVGVTTLLTVFLVVGAIQIRFHPFFWTTAMAALATLDTLVVLAQAPTGWVVLAVKALITTAFWIAVVPTVRHRRLVERFPDLYIAQRIHGTHLSRKLGRGADDPARARRAFEEAAARGWRLSAVAATVVLGLSTLGTWQVAAQVRPPSLEAVLADVRAAWRAGDAEAVVALAPPSERAERAELLAAIAAGHGWGGSWPALAEPEAEQRGARVVARFDLDPAAAEGLSAPAIGLSLVRRESGWVLAELMVPLPAVDAELARFAEAWQRADAEALAALFGAERADRMLRSVERSVERRGWGATWPALEGGELVQQDERRYEAVYDVPGGRVTAHWRFEPDGRWILSGLELPDR